MKNLAAQARLRAVQSEIRAHDVRYHAGCRRCGADWKLIPLCPDCYVCSMCGHSGLEECPVLHCPPRIPPPKP